MTSSVAAVLVVFGRGVLDSGGRYELSPASVARVRAAVDYVAAYRPPAARVIFTGGWPTGMLPPPPGHREGDLMLALARDAGLDRHADLTAETRSRSTLQNLAYLRADDLLPAPAFDAASPLGLVSHDWHLPRIRFLAGKVLGLHRAALLDVPVHGDQPATGLSPRILHLAARLGYLGSRDPAVLLRRERRLIGATARFGRFLGKGVAMTRSEAER